MQFKNKLISCFMMFFYVTFILLSSISVNAQVTPKVRLLSNLKKEYLEGDRISLRLNTPNYSGKVQYRVVVFDNERKVKKELWSKNKDFYSSPVNGKNIFNVNLRLETGTYNLFIYAKSKDAKPYNNSYIKTSTFTVKPKIAKETIISKKSSFLKGTKHSPLVYNNLKLNADNIILTDAIINSDLYINGNYVSVNSIVVKGKVFVNPGENGTSFLNDLTADTIVVLSGGSNSIHLNNVKANFLEINTENKISPVRIEVIGKSEIVNTIVKTDTILDAPSGGFGTIEINNEYIQDKNINIELRGVYEKPIVIKSNVVLRTDKNSKVEKIEISSNNNLVKMDGIFKNVVINSESKIEFIGNTKVDNLEVNSKADIKLENGVLLDRIVKNTDSINIIDENKEKIEKEQENVSLNKQNELAVEGKKDTINEDYVYIPVDFGGSQQNNSSNNSSNGGSNNQDGNGGQTRQVVTLNQNIELKSQDLGSRNVYTVVNGNIKVTVGANEIAKITNVEVNGDIIVDGGGDLILDGVVIKNGKLIIKDVATHTLSITNSTIPNVSVEDNNGGRILLENSNIGEFKTEKDSQLSLELKDDTYIDDLYVNSNSLNIIHDATDEITDIINFVERGDNTTLSSINIEGTNLTLDDVRRQVNTAEKIVIKLDQINNLYVSQDGTEETTQWIENGKRMMRIIDDAVEMGILKSEYYTQLDEVLKTRVANSIRAIRRDRFGGKFSSIDEVQEALDKSIEFLYIINECLKLEGWAQSNQYYYDTNYVVISNKSAGDDITEDIFKLRDGKKLSADIKITVLNVYRDVSNEEFIQVFKDRAFLMKQNTTYEESAHQIDVNFLIERYDKKNNFIDGSMTNLIAKIKKMDPTSNAVVNNVGITFNQDGNIDFNIITSNATNAAIEIYELNDQLQLNDKKGESLINEISDGVILYTINSLDEGKDYAIKVTAYDENNNEFVFIKRFTYELPLNCELILKDNTEKRIDIDSSNVVHLQYDIREYKFVEAQVINKRTNTDLIFDNRKYLWVCKAWDPQGNPIINKIMISPSYNSQSQISLLGIGITNPEDALEGVYTIKLCIYDNRSQPIVDLGYIYVNFTKENSILDFIEIFKNFSEETKNKYYNYSYDIRTQIRNQFMQLLENERTEQNFIQMLENNNPSN